MIDKVIYLNGKRLVITGVNRHEWSAKTGRSISMDEMTADIDCRLEIISMQYAPVIIRIRYRGITCVIKLAFM